MSYNGSGTFNLYTPGNPVVTGTTISSTWANNTLSDIGTGLSTAVCKDGQTTTTARVPFAQGVSSTLTTDATSSTTGSIITAGGISSQKTIWAATGYVGISYTVTGTTLGSAASNWFGSDGSTGGAVNVPTGAAFSVIENNATTRFSVLPTGVVRVPGNILMQSAPVSTSSGNNVAIGGTHRTTIGANGAATALTANPVGYIDADVAGVTVQIPYYNRGA